MIENLVKSGILEWSEDNIEKTPQTSGVYVLTNSPTNGSAIGLKYVDNLRLSLQELSRSFSDVSHPQFFYWYATSGDEALSLVEKLRMQYNIPA